MCSVYTSGSGGTEGTVPCCPQGTCGDAWRHFWLSQHVQLGGKVLLTPSGWKPRTLLTSYSVQDSPSPNTELPSSECQQCEGENPRSRESLWVPPRSILRLTNHAWETRGAVTTQYACNTCKALPLGSLTPPRPLDPTAPSLPARHLSVT